MKQSALGISLCNTQLLHIKRSYTYVLMSAFLRHHQYSKRKTSTASCAQKSNDKPVNQNKDISCHFTGPLEGLLSNILSVQHVWKVSFATDQNYMYPVVIYKTYSSWHQLTGSISTDFNDSSCHNIVFITPSNSATKHYKLWHPRVSLRKIIYSHHTNVCQRGAWFLLIDWLGCTFEYTPMSQTPCPLPQSMNNVGSLVKWCMSRSEMKQSTLLCSQDVIIMFWLIAAYVKALSVHVFITCHTAHHFQLGTQSETLHIYWHWWNLNLEVDVHCKTLY